MKNTQTGLLTSMQLHESREHLEHEMLHHLSASHESLLRWKGSRADLMELIYLLYSHGALRDAQGLPLGLRCLARNVCAAFHLHVPANPCSMGRKACARKGSRVTTYLERYAWQRCVGGVEHPLGREIEYVKRFVGKEVVA